jgi:NarL family two-component system response regulator LiaR
VVGHAVHGIQAIECAARLQPHVVLMDVEMPVLNGLKAAARIASRHPGIRVIFLTGLTALASADPVFGAAECLAKAEVTLEKLLEAIRRVVVVPESATSPPEADDYRAQVEGAAARASLSPFERLVLEQLVCSDRTVRQIATELTRSSGRASSEASVRHAIERVMNKLEVEPRTRAALVKRVLDLGSDR